MNYLKLTDGVVQYPFSLDALRQENPNTSFPREMPDELLAEYGVFPVIETTPPPATIFTAAKELSPVFIDGVWQQQWGLVAVPPPESITRRQCALQLLAMQTITASEALAMTKAGDVPAAIAAVFDAAVANGTMTADQRILAEIDFAATNYYRSNSLLSMMGLTDEQIDQFFISASTR